MDADIAVSLGGPVLFGVLLSVLVSIIGVDQSIFYFNLDLHFQQETVNTS